MQIEASVATRQCRYDHTRRPPYGFESPFNCSAHSTKANNGIPIVTTFSSVAGALMEQLIFEFASLSSCPTNCTNFLRDSISIRTAILHYLNKYRTIATTDTKASAQELWRARKLLRAGSSCARLADASAIKRPAERALSVMSCIADNSK